jgi:hypothetical protein
MNPTLPLFIVGPGGPLVLEEGRQAGLRTLFFRGCTLLLLSYKPAPGLWHVGDQSGC